MKKRTPKLRFKEFDDAWKETPLGRICQFVNGRAYKQDELLSTGKYRVLRVGNLFNNNEWYYSNLELQNDKYVELDDLIYAWSASFGPRFWKEEKVIYHYHIWKIITNETVVDKNFLFYLLELDVNRLKAVSQGGTMFHITKSTIESRLCLLPRISEQQKIASFLSAVDEKIQQLKRKKELLEQYKKGLMQQLFSGKLRFKDENGKTFPKWEEKTMFDVSEDVSYGMNAAAIEYDGKHKYIRITDIDESSGKFNPNPLSSPDGEIEEKFKLKEGDIVFARTGASVGKAYLYNRNDGDLYYAGFLIKFSIVRANPVFIYCLTQRYEYYKWVHVYSMRSGQPGLNAEEYKALKFKLPSLEEQQKIASYLSSLDAKIDGVDTQITQTQKFKKGLLQQMFV